jgi:hypothetical protein
MNSLDAPDSMHLLAAIGWLELGNCVEAKAELDKIAPRFHSAPEVLYLRCAIYALTGQWEAASAVAKDWFKSN